MCALSEDGFLKISKVVGDGVLLSVTPSELESLKIEELNEAANACLTKVSSEVSSGVNGTSGASVVRLVAGHDLVLSSEPSGGSNGDFVCIGASEREHEASDVGRGHIIEDLSQLGLRLGDRQAAIDVVQCLKLLGNGISNGFRAAVAEVVVDCLRGHAEILFAIIVIEVDSLAALNGHGALS